MPTKHPQYEHALPAYAAFKPADVEDARRRRPATDLRAYAQSRGLEFLESRNPMGYWGVVPADERLQFNVVRGVLPGGRHGILFHHLHDVPVYYDHDLREWRAALGAKVYELTIQSAHRVRDVKDALHLVPVVGMFVDSDMGEERPMAAGMPMTVAATHVPQLATVPPFQVVNDDKERWFERLDFLHNGFKLERFGFPGMWADAPGAPDPDEALVERLMATSFAGVLRSLGERAYLRVRIDHGQVAVGIDGFVDQDGVLDVLGEAVAAAADGIAEAARPMHEPRPFAEPLPDANWPERQTHEQVLRHPSVFPPEPYVPGMLEGAKKRGWIPEDSTAYHLAFPDLPVPGTAFAVMRFTPPGTTAIGRVAWHAERPMSRYNIGRNAVLLPAPGAAPTPPGGVRRADLNLHYAIAGGILCAWRARDQDPVHTMVGMEAVVNDTLELARAEGLALR